MGDVVPLLKVKYKKKKKNIEFKEPCLSYCQHCGRTGVPIERHHIKRRSQGGTNNPKNRIDLCANYPNNCHDKAGARLPGYKPRDLYWKKWEDKKRRRDISNILR